MRFRSFIQSRSSVALLLSVFPIILFGLDDVKTSQRPHVVADGSSRVRDDTLRGLATLLNSHRDLFQRWTDSQDDFVAFLAALEPWIVSPPAYPLPVGPDGPLHVLPRLPDVNCSNPRYSNALTGTKLPEPRVIVDFVPFGFDIDLLEIRLHETYEVVDAFVVYESPVTQLGLRKPLYYHKLADTERFKHFKDKIIYLNSSYEELRATAELVTKGKEEGKNVWHLEKAMRTEMVRRFVQLDLQKSPLKAFVMRNLGNAWGIQNDGDEMINGEALNHLRHCDLKPHLRVLYAPNVVFKNNYHWMEATRHPLLQCVTPPNLPSETSSAVKPYLWHGGPTVIPLHKILSTHSTHRGIFTCKNESHGHLGMGAATHMSSISEPSAFWLKAGGTIESHFRGALHPAIIHAGKEGTITPQLIIERTLLRSKAASRAEEASRPHIWCEVDHVTTLHVAAQAIVNGSIPRLVRMYPERYPFLVPGNTATGKNGSSLFAPLAQPEWAKSCRGRQGTAQTVAQAACSLVSALRLCTSAAAPSLVHRGTSTVPFLLITLVFSALAYWLEL